MTWPIDELAGYLPVRAEEPGTLRAAQAVLDLPAMTPVLGRQMTGEPDDRVRGWAVAQRVPDQEATWRCWAAAFDRTGLWPLGAGHVERSLLSGPVAAPEDAAMVLEECWRGCTPVLPDGTLLARPPWPGLAPARGAPDERGVVLPRGLTLPLMGRLLLVPARRPADVLAQLGWFGACNWSLTGAAVAGVLRSWEERFGAYLVGVGSATLDLVVTRPPATARQLDLLTHEHFVFCPDNFFPQTGFDDQPISHEEYAARLRTASSWHFWWD